jgi:hypothetical protein
MKKLMTFELYKSTYMSAANKLEDGHKKRAEQLKKHAAEKGIASFMGQEGFQRIYKHAFVFENHKDCKGREDFLGKFFITDLRESGGYMSGYFGINVEMKSDYGKKIDLTLVVGEKNFLNMEIEYGDTGISSGPKIRNFKFDNRKDAIEFRKFILEICEDNEILDGSYIFNLESMPINKLYTTE